MKLYSSDTFNEHDVLHELKHYLPAQAPLKDFIHHNTLHVFQDRSFFDALRNANNIFGYKTSLSISEFRALYAKNKISEAIVERVIREKLGEIDMAYWKECMFTRAFDETVHARVGQLRKLWKSTFHFDMDSQVQPTLFRILCSYLDQGIALWQFPVHETGLLASLRELEQTSFIGLFKSKRAKNLLINGTSIRELLSILVGNEALFRQYLFDQQFAHQGWSGMVSVIEDNPHSLLDEKKISLREVIIFELLLELDALDSQYGEIWKPLGGFFQGEPKDILREEPESELSEVLSLWQEAYEWTYYDEVLAGISHVNESAKAREAQSFQALFCIDDREFSLRTHVEEVDPNADTYGTPGFFGVEFYYKPEHGKFKTKLCPAPVTPKYLIKEVDSNLRHDTDIHIAKHSHSLFSGWLISQTIGFWSALRLFINIFKPSMSPATATSFRHMDEFAKLTIVNNNPDDIEDGLQVGFTMEEMANRVQNLLKSIGLVNHFAPVVYAIGHGSSSVNNPHYAAYDCGACSGRPGSVNARVISFMANHKMVRAILEQRGIHIPMNTQFVGGLHDTTRDEIVFYDEDQLSEKNKVLHLQNKLTFEKALDLNAKERSRRFEVINSKKSAKSIHDQVKIRSVSLFEPRPELNHATNALCIIGRRSLTHQLFLDRRAFLNSFDPKLDADGTYLLNILKAAAPVCGGINLEYFFSRVDNQKLGAGTKLPHNVMGLIGVANGIDGDLRPGLPSQMIEIHDPVRLLIVVEHYPEVILKTLEKSAETFEWFLNNWIHLVAVDPDSGKFSVFRNGVFEPYHILKDSTPATNQIEQLISSTDENLPVYIIQS